MWPLLCIIMGPGYQFNKFINNLINLINFIINLIKIIYLTNNLIISPYHHHSYRSWRRGWERRMKKRLMMCSSRRQFNSLSWPLNLKCISVFIFSSSIHPSIHLDQISIRLCVVGWRDMMDDVYLFSKIFFTWYFSCFLRSLLCLR